MHKRRSRAYNAGKRRPGSAIAQPTVTSYAPNAEQFRAMLFVLQWLRMEISERRQAGRSTILQCPTGVAARPQVVCPACPIAPRNGAGDRRQFIGGRFEPRQRQRRDRQNRERRQPHGGGCRVAECGIGQRNKPGQDDPRTGAGLHRGHSRTAGAACSLDATSTIDRPRTRSAGTAMSDRRPTFSPRGSTDAPRRCARRSRTHS